MLANELKLQQLLITNKKLNDELSGSYAKPKICNLELWSLLCGLCKTSEKKNKKKKQQLQTAINKKQRTLVGDLLNEDSESSSGAEFSSNKCRGGENVVDSQSCLELKYDKFRIKRKKQQKELQNQAHPDGLATKQFIMLHGLRGGARGL